jgi:SAM-dependent methyltransferase
MPADAQGIIDGYAAATTPALIAAYDGLAVERIYAPVLDLFPVTPVRVADIGAGTGRDAAWFAGRGHAVVAVEPVRELREAGTRLHGAIAIAWLDDRLPHLSELRKYGRFALVTLCGVWQHLDAGDQQRAAAGLGRIAAEGGLVIMSLRHGPGVAGRPVYPISPDATIAACGRAGFALVRRLETDSIQAENQANNVRWTWLAFSKSQAAT